MYYDKNNEYKVKVKCKYTLCTGNHRFKCITNNNYVPCGVSHTYRYVDWTFYLINKEHLIEAKDD